MIFVKYPDVKGDCNVDGYVDQLMVDSFQFGVGLGVGRNGPSAERTTSVPQFSEISFSRSGDAATPQLMQLCASATPKSEVIITITREDNGKHLPMTEIKLSDVFISSISCSSGGDVPHESLSLNFDTIVIDYTSQKSAGGQEGKTTFGWDLGKNTKK